MQDLVLYNKNNNQFDLFLYIIFISMMISSKYNSSIKINVIRRKINQYTNWNIYIIFINHILINVFGIHNLLISKFIANNSFNIMVLFHSFLIYDPRVLFETIDGEPFVLNKFIKNKHITASTLLRCEYMICNVIFHILPVYFYRDTLIHYRSHDDTISMFLYTIFFKFMWALNIFGNFNITSIYVPTFEFCNVKLINMIVVFDYLIDKTLMYLSK
jgi:hypothetical protein